MQISCILLVRFLEVAFFSLIMHKTKEIKVYKSNIVMKRTRQQKSTASAPARTSAIHSRQSQPCGSGIRP